MKSFIHAILAVSLLGLGVCTAQGDGLNGRYYSGYSLVDTVITVSEAQFVMERIDPAIDFWTVPPSRYFRWEPLAAYREVYGVVWTGFLRIDLAGDYAFGTISDDGSQVWIDGQLVVDNYEAQWWDWEDSLVEGSYSGIGAANDGGRTEAFPGPLALAEGFHRIEVRFYETGNYDGIELWWLLPGSGPSDIPYYGTSYHGIAITANPATNWSRVPASVLYSSNPAAAVGAGASGAAASLQAHPNPFNPSTTIAYRLPEAGPVTLAVYDVSGRLVKVLIDADAAAGSGTVTWNGTDRTGVRAATGVYFVRLATGRGIATRKVMLAK